MRLIHPIVVLKHAQEVIKNAALMLMAALGTTQVMKHFNDAGEGRILPSLFKNR